MSDNQSPTANQPAAAPVAAPVAQPAAAPAQPAAPAANPYAGKPAEAAPQAQPAAQPAPAAQPEPQKPAQPAAKDQNFWAKNANLTSVAKMGAQAQEAMQRASQLEAQLAEANAALKSQADQLVKDLPTETMRNEIMTRTGGDPRAIIDRVNLLKAVGAVAAPIPAAPNTSVAPTSTPSPASAEDPDIAYAREVQRLETVKAFQSAGLMKNANRARYDAGMKKLQALSATKN